MKILLVNPNISSSVTSLIETEARRTASPGTALTAVTAKLGVAYIETRAEAAVGGYATLEMLAEHGPDHDAAVVAAFGDPGLAAAKELMAIPVIGLTEAALVSARLIGGRFGIIAISARIRAWYRDVVEAYGALDRLAAIRCLDEAFEDVAGIQVEKAERLIELCRRTVREDGADTLILAGAPLSGLARTVRDELPVPLIDGVASAVRLAEAQAGLACGRARAGSMAPQPPKAHAGLPPALARLIGRT